MSTSVLATKLYIPPARPKAISRPRLVERLTEGLHRKLTLICAPAGFGKTTLASAWVASCGPPVAWLSLDEGDNDLTRFLTHLVAALQTIAPSTGEEVSRLLQSPQPPSVETILTALLNEITTIRDKFVLVLDDYHVIEAKPVDQALNFLIEHLPPQMHLVIATREDPQLPLARLRARDQLTELRVTDLRFTPSEAAGFLNHAMDLDLSAEDIDALETRTEGWIAGLQLAALSMQGHKDVTGFIKSFTGSSRFIIDYLAEEVLEHQSEEVRAFLLRTSILERMCAPLCDAVLNPDSEAAPPGPQELISSQVMLEKLERSNLFIVPLDNERRWYRYHHLFADLLRQRLRLRAASAAQGEKESVAELHIRASKWYEDNGFDIEAFQHAASANDIERAERLIEGTGVPLHFRGAGAPVGNWLRSLPAAVLNARPSLLVTYASVLMMTGQPTAVEEKLQAAEAALEGDEPDEEIRDLIGRIASLRATLAVMQHDVEALIAQSRRALEYLNPNNLPLRTAAYFTLGHAHHLQGDRVEARRAYAEVISISKSFGPSIYTTAATLCLGQVQEAENHLRQAAETYRRAIFLAGDPPRPIACNAHLGLAQVYYQWNDLNAAEQHGQQCLHLTRQMDSVETIAACGVLLARLKLVQGDVPGAVALLEEAETFVRQHNFMFRMPDVAAAQVLTLLRQGNLAAAGRLAETHNLPLSQARVYLAQGDPATALSLLEPLRREAAAKGWEDERLKVMVLQSVALFAGGEKEQAVQLIGDVLALAEPEGFIRTFVDEGLPMSQLLTEVASRGLMLDYIGTLQAVFESERPENKDTSHLPMVSLVSHALPIQPLTEPLSQREIEVLQLMAEGLSNREISERLFLVLSTVKGHNLKIFGKLQVQRRTEAVAKGRALGLL